MIAYLIKFSLLLLIALAGYAVFLRNEKRFHWTRFYLLSALLLSFSVPVINIGSLLPDKAEEVLIDNTRLAGKTINVTYQNASDSVATSVSQQQYLPWLLIAVYGLGVVVMSVRFARNLWALQKTIRSAEKRSLGSFVLALTDMNTTPYSFGKWVVVNKTEYDEGLISKEILEHEQAHVKFRHSIDRVLVECLLIALWFHPFIWWFRNLLAANHEYAADHFATSNSSCETYSQQLLNYLKRATSPALASGISYSLIKKRILMMGRYQTSAVTFYARLTLIIATFVSYACTVDSSFSQSHAPTQNSDFVVVIDAGHGGIDKGAEATKSSLSEKDITHALADAIRTEGGNSKAKFVFTRNGDEALSLQNRANFSSKYQADLFISLHVNHHENADVHGVEIYYSGKNRRAAESKRYAEQFAENVFLYDQSSKVVETTNPLVLTKSSCPAVIISTGFMSNASDLAYISSPENQMALAKEIVKVVEELIE